MTAKKESKCAAKCGGGKCPVVEKSQRGIKETAQKVVEKVKAAVKKLPPFLVRMQSELERLLDLIAKAEAALSTLEVFTRRDNASRHSKALLQRQVKAMKAYAEALKARIEDEKAKL